MASKKTVWEQEYARLWKREKRFLEQNQTQRTPYLNRRLETVVPKTLQKTLESAFEKAFSTVLEKGTGLIEGVSGRRKREREYLLRRYAAQLQPDRRSLRAFSRAAAGAGRKNLLLSGVEGVGLGLVGVGLPDVVLFTGVLLKSLCELAVNYGYPWDGNEERRFVLELIPTALSCGEELRAGNAELNHFLQEGEWTVPVPQEELRRSASAALSRNLLYMKFLQGIPVAGAVGGAWDAVVLKRVQRYAELKYRRRFLLDWKRKEGESWSTPNT
ncbi:EcsC family protein [Oscillibacter sp. MSJ-2]|uniref:EcsC family protein n=1 Tax=Dysosmobacter acutus TaxID=2841504 RepID=A0ABS6F9S0_9FIRM|nr:EcsC family protein [Dysosmobacter acutus]MBU5626287.1 EcsC family protein [Dysosmobacter acutus]